MPIRNVSVAHRKKNLKKAVESGSPGCGASACLPPIPVRGDKFDTRPPHHRTREHDDELITRDSPQPPAINNARRSGRRDGL